MIVDYGADAADLVERGPGGLAAHVPGPRRGGDRRSTPRASQDITCDVPSSTSSPSPARAGFDVRRRHDAGRVARRRSASTTSSTKARATWREPGPPRRPRGGRGPEPGARGRRARPIPRGLGAHRVVVLRRADVAGGSAASAAQEPRRASPRRRGRSEVRMPETIESLLAEGRTFPPPEAFKKTRARRPAPTSTTRPTPTTRGSGPGRRSSARLVRGVAHGPRVGRCPFAKWFVGGKLNVAYNCLDRHVTSGHGDQVAYHWEGEPGDTRTITYAQLLDDVSRLANALKSLGVAARRPRRASTSAWCPSCRWRCSRAPGSARRTRSSSAGSPSDSLRDRIQDAEAKVVDHRRRRVAARPGRPAQADDRRRSRRVPVDREGARAPAHRAGRRPDDRRPRRLVARPRAAAERRLPARADGRRGPALPALHERHDGAAQGHHAHDRRLPHPGRVHAQARLRPRTPTPTSTGAPPTSAG